MNLEILHEDDSIIVCYKPAGVPTQTKKFGQQDMESLLKNYRAKKKEQPYIGVVHRLDQPVEGVMVYAKTQEAAAELSKQVRERNIGKHYYAFCQAATEEAKQLPNEGTLTDFIAFDKRSNVSEIVPEAVARNKGANKDAKKAVLDYKVVRDSDEGRLFDVTLHTGRHHQIRLQLSHAGWPIVGDTKYNKTAAGERGQSLALCSYCIEFAHPKTNQMMTFEIKPKQVQL